MRTGPFQNSAWERCDSSPGNASGFDGALSVVTSPLLILDWAARKGGVDNEDVIG